VNHTRFPKEDHLPDCASRDNQVKKGDHVDAASLDDTEGDADVFTEMRMSAILAVRKVCLGVFEYDQVQ